MALARSLRRRRSGNDATQALFQARRSPPPSNALPFPPIKILLPTLTLLLTSLALTAATANLPLHSADALVIEKLAKHNGLDAASEVNPTKGWPALKGKQSVRFAATDGKKVLLVGHDAQGRITKLIGNGPLLANEAYSWLAGLTELRSIRIDHNIPDPGSPLSRALYGGSGLAALANSKLEEIKIGHAFDNQGMAALAKVKSLRVALIGHSKATAAGVAHFANLETESGEVLRE